MAKPFYSLEEVSEKLGKDEEGIKALVRAGELREFRDAGKVFYKAEEVDRLSGGGAGDDTGELPSLADDAQEDVVLEPVSQSDDTGGDALPSLGDSGSEVGGTSLIGLAPIEEEEPPPPANKKEGTVISASGIGVFDDDELEIDADPMAKTQITSSGGGDMAVEGGAGSGSGSGLLDLTRESDDTALGAELLDEIYPGEDDAAPAPAAAPVDEVDDVDEAEEVEDAAPEPAPESFAAAPVAVVAASSALDPTQGMFGGLLAGTALVLAVGGAVGAAAVQQHQMGLANLLSTNFYFLLGGAVLVPILGLLVGWLLGRGR